MVSLLCDVAKIGNEITSKWNWRWMHTQWMQSAIERESAQASCKSKLTGENHDGNAEEMCTIE